VNVLTNNDPSIFSNLVVEWGHVENITKDRCVEDLDTDIAIEQCSNQARDERDGVSKSLPSICRVWNSCQCQFALEMTDVVDIPWYAGLYVYCP